MPRRFLKPLALASDEELVDQVRRGNERAFETMHRRYAPALLSFVRHSLGSQEDAEDAIQQTFFKAYRSMKESRNAIQLKPWLYTIARNECVSIIRRRSIRPADPYEEGSGPSTIGLSEQVETREELRETLGAISRLPGEQRQALILTSLGTLSGDEIGRVLGCDRAKVKSLVFRARTTLAKAQEGRDTGCEEIRRQLSELRGGALRRKALREHLLECEGCREFQRDMRRQRQLVAALLPVTPLGVAKVAGALSTLGGGALAGGGAVSGGSAAFAGSGIGAGAAGLVVAAALSIGALTHSSGAESQAAPLSRGGSAVEVAYGVGPPYGQGLAVSGAAMAPGLTRDVKMRTRRGPKESVDTRGCRRECGARISGGVTNRPGRASTSEPGAASSPDAFALSEPQQTLPAEAGLPSDSSSGAPSARDHGGPPSASSGGRPSGSSGGGSPGRSGDAPGADPGAGASGHPKGGPPGRLDGGPPSGGPPGPPGKPDGDPPGKSVKRAP